MPAPHRSPSTGREGYTARAGVTISRAPSEVFAFYRDFRNLPRFLGDVTSVRLTGPTTSRWTVQGPRGLRIRWTVRVTQERPNEMISYKTTMPPWLRTRWTLRFDRADGPGRTEVSEVMSTPLGKLGRAALALAGKSPEDEMAANLRRLKQLMETGKVTDTSYAVAGKFAPRDG
ncbi:hypothetical protein GCM10018793_24000 [Streptomyces sulfonofaciens]|uniref:Cyclase n=1 Tax=Streptomyces sulfonofaciens TaxID=68272 RepID=A0A919G3N2_9ACTN|nr:SRPBCC family protein [Streptomyces sulfonofaciens]GHH76938.1 hypothetical protein GCM10018793_24000 [Streptomyces sulfonofaciens]